MVEIKKSWSIPIGKSELITVFSGTRQILSYSPDLLKDVIVDVTITEISKE